LEEVSVVWASRVGAFERVHVAADLKLEGLDAKLVGDEKESDPGDEDGEDRREESPAPAGGEEQAFLEEVEGRWGGRASTSRLGGSHG